MIAERSNIRKHDMFLPVSCNFCLKHFFLPISYSCFSRYFKRFDINWTHCTYMYNCLHNVFKFSLHLNILTRRSQQVSRSQRRQMYKCIQYTPLDIAQLSQETFLCVINDFRTIFERNIQDEPDTLHMLKIVSKSIDAKTRNRRRKI